MFRPRLAIAGACFLSILFSALTASAAQRDPWDAPPFSVTPSALATSAQNPTEPEKDVPVKVLLDEATFTFDSDGKCTRTTHLIYRIVSTSGTEDWASVETEWFPWYQEAPTIRARVIAPDGAVHELDPSTIDDSPGYESDPELYSDSRVARAPLPAIHDGVTVEEEIVIRDKAPFFDGGTRDTFYVGRYAPERLSRLQIDVPVSLPFRFVNRAPSGTKVTDATTDGVRHLTFETRDLKPYESGEGYTPSDVYRWPYVGFSTGKSWNDVAKRYADIVDQQLGGSDLSSLVRDVIGNAKDRNQIIDRMLAKLQRDVRYTGVEFGAATIVPGKPLETLKRKYGDCKDKAALLTAMLRTAGIKADLAVLRSGFAEDVEPELPGFGGFDHAIVYVGGDDPIFVDPTDEFTRAGELPLSDQGRLALIANRESTGLVKTPEFPSSKNHISQTREFVLQEENGASVVETTTVTGSIEDEYRTRYAALDAKSLKETFESFAKDAYRTDKPVKYTMTDPHDLSKPFTLRLEMTDARRGMTADGVAAVGVFPSQLLDRLPSYVTTKSDDEDDDDSADESKKDKPRVNDFVFYRPYTFEWHYKVTPPPGYKASEATLPESETIKVGLATLTKKFAIDSNGVLTADYSFDSGPRRIKPAELAEMKEKASEIASDDATLLNFESVGKTYLDAGQIGDALGEYRRLSRLHPKEALHHREIALALLQGGLGEEARKEARLAVTLEPKSALAHRTLGWTLEHDLIGRRFAPGFDLKGAIAEYRKAKELDPKDQVSRAELAIVLEHDENGVRYSEKADMKAAEAEYRALEKDLDEKTYNQNLLYVLMWTHQFEELKKIAKANDGTENSKEFQIIATAATSGSESALRTASSLITDRSQLRSSLATCAQTLIQLRKYKEAADLLTAASKGAPNAADLKQRIDLLRKVTPYEKLPLDDNEPATVVKKLLITAFTKPHVELSDINPFLSVDGQTDSKTANSTAEFQKAMRVMSGLYKKNNVRPEVVADLAMASADFTMDGSAEKGFKIGLQSQMGSTSNDSTFFVTKESGAWKIVGTDDELSTLGRHALRRLDAGDPDSARQWLDWARDLSLDATDVESGIDNPFGKLWTKGNDADTEKIRLAAAVLASGVSKANAEVALPVIRKAYAAADDSLKSDLDAALATDYLLLDSTKELLEVSEKIAARRPDSRKAFMLRCAALAELKRWSDIENISRERLEKFPNDPDATRELANLAEHDGKLDEYARLLRKLGDSGEARSNDYNSLAWLSLFVDNFGDDGIRQAQKAVSMSDESEYASLHTLAALYAENGKTDEARQTILKAIDLSDTEQPRTTDWYVLGRIAESYGERDAALSAYKKVTKPVFEEAVQLSTWTLAQKRIKELQKKSK